MDEIFYIIFMAIFIVFFFALFFDTMVSIVSSSGLEDYLCLAGIYAKNNSTGSTIGFSLPYYNVSMERCFCNG